MGVGRVQEALDVVYHLLRDDVSISGPVRLNKPWLFISVRSHLSGTPAPLLLGADHFNSSVKSKRELICKATYTHFITFDLWELVKKIGF